MRRVHRRPLPLAAKRTLVTRQRQCHSADEARTQWKQFRQSVGAVPVVAALRQMAGTRERCVYCSDSQGADVDHHAPIDYDFDLTFAWSNLLWACPRCNRKKLTQFPTHQGSPLLIDPAVDCPWHHLILDTASGVLAPRTVDDFPDAKGEATLSVLDLLNDEAIVEGRARSIRRLRDAAGTAVVSGDTPETRANLCRETREDDLGVAAWFARSDGRDEEPFRSLAATLPELWRKFVAVSIAAEWGSDASV